MRLFWSKFSIMLLVRGIMYFLPCLKSVHMYIPADPQPPHRSGPFNTSHCPGRAPGFRGAARRTSGSSAPWTAGPSAPSTSRWRTNTIWAGGEGKPVGPISSIFICFSSARGSKREKILNNGPAQKFPGPLKARLTGFLFTNG